ncbi:MAG: hypothetical protein OXC10_21355 [Rhodospirillaceae bacterium]|nr:hypothetical protein [Rhodospirillaceae bacterium]
MGSRYDPAPAATPAVTGAAADSIDFPQAARDIESGIPTGIFGDAPGKSLRKPVAQPQSGDPRRNQERSDGNDGGHALRN